jgi:ABC-2 type transport system ATP-binding protein
MRMIATLEENQTAQMSTSRAVVACLDRVSKSYGTVTALREVNFHLEAGELVAVLGPNGAGKTTMIRILLGLAHATSGTARLFGSDPENRAARTRVGAMLQVGKVPETLSEGTVRNYLSEAISKMGASNRVEAARIARTKGWL